MIMSALTPVFFGAAMAFLANPLASQVEMWLKKKNVKKEIVILFKSMLYLVLQLH